CEESGPCFSNATSISVRFNSTASSIRPSKKKLKPRASPSLRLIGSAARGIDAQPIRRTSAEVIVTAHRSHDAHIGPLLSLKLNRMRGRIWFSRRGGEIAYPRTSEKRDRE